MEKRKFHMCLAFGKYKGKRISEIRDEEYLAFLYFDSHLSKATKVLIWEQAIKVGEFGSIREFRKYHKECQQERQSFFLEMAGGFGDFEFWK